MATNDEHTVFNRKFEIGILEVRRHTTILYSFSKIFKTKDTNVTIFTTKKLLSRLKVYNIDLENYKFIIKKDNESIRSYIKRVEVYCNNNIDVLFVNTIHETTFDLMCYLSFNPQCKTVLTVHHVNAWLRPEFIFDLFHILRTIDTIFSSILIKYFIFPKFDAINVIYHPLKDYIIKNIDFNKKIFTLPTSVFEANNFFYEKKPDYQVLKVVVPGLIQEHRKDYETMIPVFMNLFNNYKQKISLSLLGMPVGRYGKFIYKEFKKLKEQGYNVILFDDFVSDEIFDKTLRECNIILAPVRIESRADNNIKEIYGQTVGSGVIYNAILYSKPIIVPAEFNMLKELNTSTLTYSNNNELETIIKDLILSPTKLNQLKTEAYKNAEKFSLGIFRSYFKKNILSWLDKS